MRQTGDDISTVGRSFVAMPFALIPPDGGICDKPRNRDNPAPPKAIWDKPMASGGLSGEDRMLDLVGAVYDAALDADLWPDVLNRIGDAVGGPQVVFGIYDPANGVVDMHAPRTDPDV